MDNTTEAVVRLILIPVRLALLFHLSLTLGFLRVLGPTSSVCLLLWGDIRLDFLLRTYIKGDNRNIRLAAFSKHWPFWKYVVFSNNLNKLFLPYLYCIGSWKILKKKLWGTCCSQTLHCSNNFALSYDLSNTAYKNKENDLKLFRNSVLIYCVELLFRWKVLILVYWN